MSDRKLLTLTQDEIINEIKKNGFLVAVQNLSHSTVLALDKLKAFNIIYLDGKKYKFLQEGYKIAQSNTGFENWIKGPDPQQSQQVWGIEPNYKVFISHITDNKLLATGIKRDLRRFKISCFVAHEDIEPTDPWQETIEFALRTANCLIAILTPKFHASNWTDQEIGFALGRDIPIISIMQGIDPYGFIGKSQALKIDLVKDYKKIIGAILKRDSLMVDHLISLIANSERSEFCTDLSAFIKEIKQLTESQINLLVKAFNENGFVNQSYGMRGSTSFSTGLAAELSKITGRSFEFKSEHIIKDIYDYTLIEK